MIFFSVDDADEKGMINIVPLSFHDLHGENVELSSDKRVAKRIKNFCDGICFSNRPVAINEYIYVKIVDVDKIYVGGIKFGFTSVDPGTIDPGTLPHYACPDLGTRNGYWVDETDINFAKKDNILFCYVSQKGEICIGVNGQEKKVICANVDTSGLLWVLIDLYGNTSCIQLMGKRF